MTDPTQQTTPTLDLDFVRSHFPALAQEWAFFDNAGGSQTLQSVIERIAEFLVDSNVQLGAPYEVSQLAGKRVAQGSAAIAQLINAPDPSTVVLGASASALFRMLAYCFGQTLQPGDEIIVTNCDHECHITPWVELERQGIVIKTWGVEPDSFELQLEDLAALLTDRTRLVAVTHTSNVLGMINPIRAIADLVHQHGALICVDGVAYAAHRRVDVQALDVDFYALSVYKVYGPHMAMLYGKREHLVALPGYNNYFVEPTAIPYKFQPGGTSYELTYSAIALPQYLQALARHHFDQQMEPPADQIVQAFDLISAHETALSDRLLTFLRSKPNVRIIGTSQAAASQRVPTIAFVVEDMTSDQIPPRLAPHQIGIRSGHFNAIRLTNALDLGPYNGAVRVSMVHYNTLEECDRLIERFAEIF
ncbi:MAG: cysteine desulfurase-like protein [Leptolyngbyaceae cyanobacterium]